MLKATGVGYVVGGRHRSGRTDRGRGTDILRDIDLRIRPGAFVGVIGPNGAGKTTLMRVLAGVLRPTSGEVLFEGGSVHRLSETARARSIAFMSQNPGIGFGFTVADVVSMGRYAHRSPWWRNGLRGREEGARNTTARAAGRGANGAGGERDDRTVSNDQAIVERAMAATEVSHLRDRPVTNLSGGEAQRVFLARTLAQQPRLLFLDEPTSDLDIRFQMEILDLVRDLRQKQNLTVVMAIHDLTWALRYCDEILALQDGRVAGFGHAGDVLTPDLISDVFGVRAHIGHGTDGSPRVDFVERAGGSR